MSCAGRSKIDGGPTGSFRADLIFVRNWGRRIGVGPVPGIREALGFRTGRCGLARLEGIERTAAPTGIVNTLDAKWVSGDGFLGRGRAAHQQRQK
jgi:hypothetical protein